MSSFQQFLHFTCSLPFRTTCYLPLPYPARFPRWVSRVPFIPHNVLHDRASEGNAPHRTHMAGLLSFTSVVRPPGPVPFLVFPLLSNRWMESKATGSKGKENITNSSIDYPPSFTMIPAKAPYHA